MKLDPSSPRSTVLYHQSTVSSRPGREQSKETENSRWPHLISTTSSQTGCSCRGWDAHACLWAPYSQQLWMMRERNSSRAASSFTAYSCFDTCKGQRQRAGHNSDGVKSAHSVINAFWEVSEGRVFRARVVKMNEKDRRWESDVHFGVLVFLLLVSGRHSLHIWVIHF